MDASSSRKESDPDGKRQRDKRKQTCRKSTGLNRPVFTTTSIARHVKPGHGEGKANRMREIARIERERRTEEENRRVARDIDHTQLPIKRRPFRKLIRALFTRIIEQETDGSITRIQPYVENVLLEASAAFLTQLFEQCNLAVVHARRVTLMPRDINLVLRVDGSYKSLGLS